MDPNVVVYVLLAEQKAARVCTTLWDFHGSPPFAHQPGAGCFANNLALGPVFAVDRGSRNLP